MITARLPFCPPALLPACLPACIPAFLPACLLKSYSNTKSSDRSNETKWNESGFRPPLCTYRLNWARRTSWGWWDDWDDSVLQTQDPKFEPWRSEAEHATSRSRRLPTILMGTNHFCFFQTAETGNRASNSGVKGSGANHYPRAPAQRPISQLVLCVLHPWDQYQSVGFSCLWWSFDYWNKKGVSATYAILYKDYT